jgi:hypothetical protein
MTKLPRSNATQELGVSSGAKSSYRGIRFGDDEFLQQLRGDRAIKVYREMRDNDAVVGALMTAMDMMLRAVEWRVEPASEEPDAIVAKEFVESLFDDMSHTFDEFMSEVLSFLTFGFSFFETVYKQRLGPDQADPAKRSKFNDGKVGIRKLAPRAQWTLDHFEVDDSGGLEAFVQRTDAKVVKIPIEKGLLFRTSSSNGGPVGRSVLRNAYLSWYMLSHIQVIEGIAIERELNGLPVGKMPSSYLAADADATKQAVKTAFEQILRDVKNNEQGYILLPSDLYPNVDGSPSGESMISFELMSSSGTRDIDTGGVIRRYQGDIARTVLADFILLGQTDKGSFALSKSKTDLFLRALEGYLNNVAAVINRYLLPPVWQLNGFDRELMPTMVPGNVAPVDLDELGQYINRLAGAGFAIFPDDEVEHALLDAGGLPAEQDQDPDLMGRVPDEDEDVPEDTPGAGDE